MFLQVEVSSSLAHDHHSSSISLEDVHLFQRGILRSKSVRAATCGASKSQDQLNVPFVCVRDYSSTRHKVSCPSDLNKHRRKMDS